MFFRSISLFAVLMIASAVAAGNLPDDNPVARYKLGWTDQLRWGQVVSIADFAGASIEEQLEKAQAALAAKGGGVIFFPAGEYRFRETIRLRDGIVLRGADPQVISDARQEGYAPQTRFEFPRYEPKLEGEGTAKDTAFKGIELVEPTAAGNCGLVNLSMNYGHIRMAEGVGHGCGGNRLVFGCVLRNAALIDEQVPDLSVGQKPWQRFTKWHQAAIEVFTGENALVANCRLPESTDSFNMPGYVVLGRGNNAGPVEIKDGVVFDYDNRPGIEVNPFSLGGGGGQDPKGDPETMPWGFRKGIVIRDNYIYCTGRTAVHFTGDGTIASFNVIRFKPNVMRQTNTGIHLTSGSSTNDNRAMTIRGWRYTVEGNDYLVYRNRCADGIYYINDGEGLMHEGHANCTIKDSRIIGNRGNAYLSIFLTAGIDGLEVDSNDIRPRGPGTDTKISSIFVVSDRNSDRHYCRNVKISNNTTTGSGISIIGAPAEKNLVEGNQHMGPEEGVIVNGAEATVQKNTGYRVQVPTINKPLADPNRPTAKALPSK
jgi:hypothetical protein